MAAAVPGLFAVQHDEFVARCGAAELFLRLQKNQFKRVGIDPFHQAAKGGLAWGGIVSSGLLAHAQGAALALAETFGKLGPLLLSSGRAAQMGQHADGDQAPQRINADARAVIGQALEMLDERADLRRALGAARACPGFDARQRGLELVGLETAAGLAAEFAGEEALGFVVLHVKVAAHTAEAVGRAQFLPAIGGINRAAKLFGIDERFDQHDRMIVARLPVGAEPIQRQAQRTGTEIGKGFVRQEQEAAVVDDQRQAAAALLLAPADPAVAPATGGRRRKRPARPASRRGHR